MVVFEVCGGVVRPILVLRKVGGGICDVVVW